MPQTPGCPAALHPDRSFFAAFTPRPVIGQRDGTAPGLCSIDLATQGMEVTLTLPPGDLPHWPAISDALHATLARSFTAIPNPS